MPARRERSVCHPPWLRVRWGWMAVLAFFLLISASAFGGSFFPLMFVLFISWVLWRSDRDSGRH